MKFARKAIRKVGRVVKKRYFKGKGYAKPKLGRMMKDVAMLKSMLNAEKKNATMNTSSAQNIAISNGASSGYFFAPIVPSISQGVASSQRVGNSVRLHSFNLRGRITQQASTTAPVSVRLMIVKAPGTQPSLAGTINAPAPVTDLPIAKTLLEVNPFTGFIDYYSQRAPDTFRDWIVLAKKTVTLKPDTVTGVSQIQQFRIGSKLRRHHIRYDDSGNLVDGNLFIIAVATAGDTSTSTGAKIELVQDIYFYDN